MTPPRRIAVIGAGVVGMACALRLQRAGHAVTVLDPLAPGNGASFGNAGVFAVGHVLPLGMPGVLARVPHMLLARESPLSIRWSHLPRMLPWLARLVRSSTPARIDAISAALRDLVTDGLDSTRALLGPRHFVDLVRHAGWLFVYSDAAALERDRAGIALRRARGVRIEEIEAGALRQLVPALAPSVRHGFLFPDCGHTVNPHRVVVTLAALLREAGGTIKTATARGFDIGEAGVTRVLTDGDGIATDGVVLAAGADSAALARALGSRVLLESERGYHVTMPDPGIDLRVPLLAVGEKFSITPMEHGIRLGGTAEFSAGDAPPNPRRHAMMVAQARRLLPGISDTGATTWVGRRPSTPDSLPVISGSPHHRNAWFAFGHGHVGLTTAAVTAGWIADLVAGRPPSVDLAPFRVERFS
ncbi:MAG: FAD-dependent oxidoreductase [Proteobacteria bacterium]|nr:FAD-dependent oxidoreductase [Pseudomonadota bacterium]